MKKKVIAGIIAGVLCVSTMIISASANVDLGAFNWENNDNQKGWRPNGVDDVTANFEVSDLVSAEKLVIECGNEPVGGSFFVIWQGDADGWGWNQTELAMADILSGNTITIELKDLISYDSFIACEKAKIAIGYWGGGDNVVDDLGIISAYLIGGTDSAEEPAPAAAEEDESEAAPVEEDGDDDADVDEVVFEEDTAEDDGDEAATDVTVTAVIEETATVTVADTATSAAGNTSAAAVSAKGSADTGIEGVAVIAGLTLLAAGAVVISRKRK